MNVRLKKECSVQNNGRFIFYFDIFEPADNIEPPVKLIKGDFVCCCFRRNISTVLSGVSVEDIICRADSSWRRFLQRVFINDPQDLKIKESFIRGLSVENKKCHSNFGKLNYRRYFIERKSACSLARFSCFILPEPLP